MNTSIAATMAVNSLAPTPHFEMDVDAATNHSSNVAPAPDTDDGARILAVFEEGENIAFAAFDELASEIVLESTSAFGYDTMDVIQAFRRNIDEPTVILVSPRVAANEPLLDVLIKTDLTISVGDSEPASGPSESGAPTTTTAPDAPTLPYKVLKSGAFAAPHCLANILENLEVKELNQMEQQSEQARNAVAFPPLPASALLDRDSQDVLGANPSAAYSRLSTLIDLEDSTQVRALGGLMSYLQATLFRLDSSQIAVLRVRNAKDLAFLKVDQPSLRALHIFSEQRHPNIGKKNQGSKEGFSLYSLLNRCASRPGSRFLRTWMLRPLLSVSEISFRQDFVELFMRPDLAAVVATIRKSYQRFGDASRVLATMVKCQSSPIDYIVLKKSIDAAVQIIGVFNDISRVVMDLKESDEDSGVRYLLCVETLLESLEGPTLTAVSDRINEVFDEDVMMKDRQIYIRDGFSPDLDNARARFDDLEEMLARVGATLSHEYQRELSIIFLPQVGFLISVDQNLSSNLVEDCGFVLSFAEGRDLFFKTPEMNILDDEEGDLDALIKDTEAMIAAELEEDILEHEMALRSTFSALAELDVILAFSTVAMELNCVRPEISDDENVIMVEKGRSPLQAIVTDHRYIPNDVCITDTESIAMVTGPNFSGKSCYLSMVGVLVYMAHLGCFLPCDRARIGLTDRLLVRISSVETCAVPQSTFQIDLTQMGKILRQSTPRSLVLVDEFGKGTAPMSGMSVLAAAINKLSDIGCKVVCTTHFLELFSLELLVDGRGGVKCFKMGVHVPESEDEDIVPLFKLEPGFASSSDGLACAKMAGLDAGVLKRGYEILQVIKGEGELKKVSGDEKVEKRRTELLSAFLGGEGAAVDWQAAGERQVAGLKKKIKALMKCYQGAQE